MISEELADCGYVGGVISCTFKVIRIVRACAYFGKLARECGEGGLCDFPRLYGCKDGEGARLWRLAVDDGVQAGENLRLMQRVDDELAEA
ncbi:MAG: hypothetical protein J5733_06335 [Bacteroidaceae bacterium]|nr:hypothetical protein [Bacteroidaceae bacterium]